MLELMNVDRNGLEVLGREESLTLLRTAAIGRVLVTVGALPGAFPVNFAVMGDNVVFRTGTGTKLHAALSDTVVAFQVDEFNANAQSGWSVLVTGHARQIDDPVELAAAELLPVQSWLRNAPSHFVKINSQLVTGRRLSVDGTVHPPDTAIDTGADQDERPPWSGPAVGACRECGCRELLPVSDGELTNFVCCDCAACWHVEQGWMYRVNPATCPGCTAKPACSRAYFADTLEREAAAR